MVATTQDVFSLKARFGEFSTVPDAALTSAFNVVDMLLDSRVWTNLVDFVNARLFYAAHLATIQQMQLANSANGIGTADLYMSSITFGERSVAFGRRLNFGEQKGLAGSGEEMLSMTTYGQLFLQLRNRNIVPIMVV
jgi:hypothetical protein